MAKPSDPQLLRLVHQHLDLDGLLAAHPEVTREDVAGLFARLGLDRPEAAAASSPGPPAGAPLARDSDAPRSPLHAPRHIVARCDGASRGNPGPAAIGVVLQNPGGTLLREIGERIGSATNNVAEYRAVIRAAEEALALGANHLTLLLDSELLVFQLRGSYRVKAPHLYPLYQQALGLLRRFARWDVRHVPREENAAADRLANLALDS